MEKNNGKVIAIVALIVAVVALSVGFAAFTDSLTITGTATVNRAADTFEGNFAYDSTNEETCTLAGGGALTGTYDAGTSSDDTWSGISVPLTSTQTSVKCTAIVKNNSNYDAYLKTLTISGPLTCASAGTGADAASNADAVCPYVTADVQIGETSTNHIAITSSSSTNTVSGLNQKVDKITSGTAGSVNVYVTITYDATNSPEPDGDITVTLPTITHGYSTVSGS